MIHCVKGSPGWEIHQDVLNAGAGKTAEIIDNPTFGSRELCRFVEARQYDIIELVGLCTDICVISNALCLKMVLGTFFIVGQRVLRERQKQLARSLVMMLMSIPWLILGLALLLLIRAVDLEKNLFFVLAGHIVISLPYTLLCLAVVGLIMGKTFLGMMGGKKQNV